MAQKLLGKWRLESTEGWEEYMKAVGVGMVLRKIGGKVSPYEHIKQEGDLWILDITSTFKNVYLKFKLGEEFDETTADGRNVKSTFSLDGEKLAQIQKGDVDSYITREVNSEDKMILTLVPKGKDNATCVRTFVRND